MLDGSTIKLVWSAPQNDGDSVTSYRIYRKAMPDTRNLGDSYDGHVLVSHTRSNRTSFIDHRAETGVLYEYAVAAYRDEYPNPMGTISHRAYA